MAQELDKRIRMLRVELTRVVHEGNDEDGMLLRRLLAELERPENQRMSLRGRHNRGPAPRQMATGAGTFFVCALRMTRATFHAVR